MAAELVIAGTLLCWTALVGLWLYIRKGER